MTAEEYTAVQNYIQALKAAVLTGTKQYVILGAGMDTFAFLRRRVLSEAPGIRGGSSSDAKR